MSAGLLRKLLLDGPPLTDRVNSERRIKIRFRMNGPTLYEQAVRADGATFWSLADGIDPSISRPPGLQNPIEATRDQLLAREVMWLSGTPITVRDLIAQLAHIEGAVHAQLAREPKELLLREVAARIYIRDLPAGVDQVRSIGRVVLQGLEPLRVAVTESS